MNILYITHTDSMYGANSSLIDILKNIDKKKYNVYVIIPTAGKIRRCLRKLVIKYKVIEMYSSVHSSEEKVNFIKIKKNLQAVNAICKCIKEWNIDIVHSNSSVINLGAIAAGIMRRKHIWHIRELAEKHYNFKRDLKWLDLYLLKKADKVVCISKYVKREYQKQYKLNNCEVLYNVINNDTYLIQRDKIFSDKSIKIFVCGLLHRNKMQMIVVKAVKILIEKGYNNISLQLVGDGDVFYRAKIKKYIEDNKLSEYITLHPFTPNLKEYREKADIAVVSSLYEGLGRVTIESMLSDLVVIGADSGATKELIKDNYNGFKYNPYSSEELADRIEYVIKNKEKILEVIKNAKLFALKMFSTDEGIKKLEQLYLNVLSQ